jgi:hypothetical protein
MNLVRASQAGLLTKVREILNDPTIKVRDIIDERWELSPPDRGGACTALAAATKYKCFQVMYYLLQRGAQVVQGYYST